MVYVLCHLQEDRALHLGFKVVICVVALHFVGFISTHACIGLLPRILGTTQMTTIQSRPRKENKYHSLLLDTLTLF